MPTADVRAFVRATLPAAPARVLEVGAGRGELAADMLAAGYDVVAIDPAGGPPPVRQLALLDVDGPAGSFDAAVAVVSLHHVNPLPESLARLGYLVRPGGCLIVDEFDVERLDERAAAWWIEQGLEQRRERPHNTATFAEEMRAHLHPLARLAEALAPWFYVGEPVRGAYLHRWDLEPGLRDAEEALIAAGRLPAVGARLVAVRVY
jgi:SAM-dependent methyltransferase